MPASVVEFVISPKGIASAVAEGNKALESLEQRGVRTGDGLQQAFQKYADLLLKVSDKSRQAMEGQVAAAERLAATYGRSGIEKLIAQRDHMIKQLAGEEDLIKRVTAAYDVMIKKASAGSEGGTGFAKFGEGVKSFIERPLETAGKAATSLLEKLGPVGTGLAAGGVAFTALAAAGYEAAKSLGEYGVRVKDVELRTGLSAKEVGQFGFAARAVGQDVSITERLMRGLSVAIEDNSSASDKGRQRLVSFGVDIAGIKAGAVPTSEVLRQLGEGLEKLPPGFERSKAAIDIFKRAGIEALPFLLELNQHLKEAEGLHFATEADIARYQKYQTQVAAIGTEWDTLTRKLKEPIAATVLVAIKRVGQIADFFDSDKRGPSPILGLGKDFDEWARKKYGEDVDKRQKQIEDQQRAQASAVPEGVTARSMYFDSMKQTLEGAQLQAEKLKKTYDEYVIDVSKTPPEIEKARLAYSHQTELVKELAKDEARRVALLEKTRDLLREGQGFYQIGSGRGAVVVTQQQIEDANKKYTTSFVQDTGLRGLYGVPVLQTGQRGITKGSLYAPGQYNPFAPHEGNTPDLPPGIIPNSGEFVSPSSDRGYTQAEQDRLKAFTGGLTQEAQQGLQLQLSGIKAEEQATIRLLELRTKPGGELDTAQRVAQIRKTAIDQEFNITGDIVKYREESLQNELEQRIKIAEVEQKQLDGIKRVTEGLATTLLTKPQDFPRQLRDTITSAALKPITSGIGDITARFLQPIIYGSGGQGGINGGLHGILGGGGSSPTKITTDRPLPVYVINAGGMGAASTFFNGGAGVGDFGSGGGVNFSGIPLSLMTSLLPLMAGGIAQVGSGVSSAGSSAGDWLHKLFSTGSGGSGAGPGSVSSTIDYGGGPQSTGPGSVFGGNTNGIGWGGLQPGGSLGDLSIPGATYNGGGFESFPMSHTAGSGGGLLGGLRGLFGGRTAGGIGGGFGNFGSLIGYKGSGQWNTTSTLGAQNGNFSEGSGFGGAVQGIAGSPAAGMAGMYLAQRGLLGAQAGTGLGVLEGTAGGALIGEQYGGPIGAAIGAGVGFGIGIGEVIAGVEPQWKEAERLVKSRYGITIPQAEAQKIVDIANSSFGGRVSIAVTSQQVRAMLGLYAAGTSQSMAANASIPHAAALLEQGGQLYQNSTYQYGQRQAFSSGLPIAGGYSATTLPSPNYGGGGGPQSIVLNVNGQSAADLLEGRVTGVVTPGYVQDSYSTALMNSDARVANAAALIQPGLIQS